MTTLTSQGVDVSLICDHPSPSLLRGVLEKNYLKNLPSH